MGSSGQIRNAAGLSDEQIHVLREPPRAHARRAERASGRARRRSSRRVGAAGRVAASAERRPATFADERHAGGHVAAILLELVAGHRSSESAHARGLEVVARALRAGIVERSLPRAEPTGCRDAAALVLSAARSRQHSRFFEQALRILLREVLSTLQPASTRQPDADPRERPHAEHGRRSAQSCQIPSAPRAPSSRCGPASRDRRPARRAVLVPMHQTESSALRAQVKKRPARTSIQPAVGSARIMLGSASTRSGAPICPSVLRPAHQISPPGRRPQVWNVPTVAADQSLYVGTCAGVGRGCDVADRERAARLRAPAPQAAVALARAGRRLRSSRPRPSRRRCRPGRARASAAGCVTP